jgi:hypothetical protein
MIDIQERRYDTNLQSVSPPCMVTAAARDGPDAPAAPVAVNSSYLPHLDVAALTDATAALTWFAGHIAQYARDFRLNAGKSWNVGGWPGA